MKIFGVGLNKTGTTSLGNALEVLGYKNHISCNWPLTKLWSENNISPILEEAEKYNNFEDWPWPLLYKELYEAFEDAKFILTTRSSADEWYTSLCNHALRTGPTEYRKKIFGHYMPYDYKDHHINFYNKHNEDVINFFNKHAPEKLLVINFKDGHNWEKLCDFLNVEIPETAFPFLNRDNKQANSAGSKNKFIVKFLNARQMIKTRIQNILNT